MSIVQNSNETGRLHFNADALRGTGRIGAFVIDITPYFSPERKKVEAFIRQVYAESYRANIDVHYSTLMSVRTAEGKILSAIGFRYAGDEPLFLENYTGEPIELSLARCYGRPIARGEIAEIGNLASLGHGASMYLYAALSSYLNARKIQYATITGTKMLQDRLHKLGLEPKLLCKADAAFLSDDERRCWGSYYEQNPHVMCGSVEEGVQHLQHALGMMYEE